MLGIRAFHFLQFYLLNDTNYQRRQTNLKHELVYVLMCISFHLFLKRIETFIYSECENNVPASKTDCKFRSAATNSIKFHWLHQRLTTQANVCTIQLLYLAKLVGFIPQPLKPVPFQPIIRIYRGVSVFNSFSLRQQHTDFNKKIPRPTSLLRKRHSCPELQIRTQRTRSARSEQRTRVLGII